MLIDANWFSLWFWLMLIGSDWFWLMLIYSVWCWLILIDTDLFCLILIDPIWCWLMLVDANLFCLMLIDSDRYWLILIDADWCWLMLIVSRKWPRVTQVGAYSRPSNVHFYCGASLRIKLFAYAHNFVAEISLNNVEWTYFHLKLLNFLLFECQESPSEGKHAQHLSLSKTSNFLLIYKVSKQLLDHHFMKRLQRTLLSESWQFGPNLPGTFWAWKSILIS